MFAKNTLPPNLVKNSFGDGIFATVFGTLTSGVFLTGFALYMGMNEFGILTYSILWNFAVYFASPFFTLYFLRDLGFSYAFTSIMGTISALADLTAMHLWGNISDRVRNKAVIQVCSF